MRRELWDPKTAFLNPSLQERFRVFARIFAVIVITSSLLVFTGWLTQIEYLYRLSIGLPIIQPVKALGFLLGGLALLFSTYETNKVYSKLSEVLALCLVTLGGATYIEYLSGHSSVLNEIFSNLFAPEVGGIIPATMSLLFICTGLSIFLFDKGKRNTYQLFILLAGILLLPSVIEHFYGSNFIYGFVARTRIALQSTTLFIILSVGILFARPQKGFMAIVSSESAGGFLARRMLLTSLLSPLLAGGIIFLGVKFGWYDIQHGFLLFVSAIIIIFTYVVWRNAKSIHFLDIARRDSEQSVYRLASIVESSSDAILGRDMKGIITDWNKGAENLYGYKAEEIIGKPVSLLFLEGQTNEVQKFNSFMRTGKSVKEYEALRVTKDGTLISVSISASPIRSSSGKLIGLSAISRDISERKQIEHQRELFISIASHELKTPVTSTKAYTQLLKRHFQMKKDKESLAYLTKMDEQLNKLTELIGYLLDVSTIQKRQLRLSEEKIDLDAIINETIEELRRTTKTHEIVRDGYVRKKINGDKNRITQVLRNLLTNAIKYSPGQKKVIVHTELRERSVKVSIVDYGIGIPKDEQLKVFEPLYRSSGAEKNGYSGLGLGLYITREIVRKHGGQLRLQSEVGKGTIVSFTLPLEEKVKKTKKKVLKKPLRGKRG